ncbi:MAG: restriction endonuclease [Oscillospiraceae bacterium]|nr:restriction endonuclease [Oscillospiraceae bacterium]
MARRRKKDTEKTLEFVIWLIIGIPMAIIAIIKWIFSGLTKLGQQRTIKLSSIDLKEVDQMDGFSFEYYVAELLKKNGYNQVVVTSGSGDFGVDITAYKDNKKHAFQCKNYQSKLGVSPIQEVYSGAPKYNASICVVVTNSYFTPHAQELAKHLNVMLWDRSELVRLIRTKKESLLINQPIQDYKLGEVQEAPPATTQEEAQRLISVLSQAINNEQEKASVLTKAKDRNIEMQEDLTMATTLGAGKYIFGVDIPEGKYNLKAISGSGMLQIQKLMDGTWDEEWINFGIEEHCAKTYHGLSLPKNKYFEVTGNVVFEITKATMIEIE